MAQYPSLDVEDLLIRLQQSINSLQQDLARQAEVMNSLQQQQQQSAVASTSHTPNVATPMPGTTANATAAQDPPTEGVPTFSIQTDPILVQGSKALVHQTEAPFEFEFDSTLLKVNKLEKLFKKVQGVSSILDIEEGCTKSTITLPERFKMPHIDCFDGSGDPMVHLCLFSDILRPMGLTRIQKLLLFSRTMSGIAAIGLLNWRTL
ncbi:hypothetical protein ACSBR1_034495 [Camellia fascicularis]